MLLLVITIGKENFGIDISKVIEIVPIVKLEKIPKSPDYIAGYFNYRGEIIPVMDISYLVSNKPSKLLLSTRIIIMDYSDSLDKTYKIGFLAESLTETVTINSSELSVPGINLLDNSMKSGMILNEEQGMVYHLDLLKLLPLELINYIGQASEKLSLMSSNLVTT